MQSTKFTSLARILLTILSVALGGRLLAASEPRQALLKAPDHIRKFLTNVKPGPPAGQSDFVTSVAISPDGKTIASASFYNTVKLWDLTTGKNTAVLDVNGVYTLAFSPDGKILACGSSGGFGVNGLRPEGVRLFDVATGKNTALLDHGGVNTIAFHPNGETLACARDSVKGHAVNPVISLWKVAAAKNNATLALADNNRFMVSAIAFDPDGTTLAVGGGSHDAAGKKLTPELQLWDVAAAKIIRTFTGHTGHILCAAFHRDGKLLASGGNDQTVRVWDVASGKNRATLAGHIQPVYAVVFSPDGKLLASAGDKTIRLWDVATRTNIRTIHTDWVRSLAFSPDSNTLISGGEPGHKVWVWDVASGKNRRILE